jgi:hypothetical protein
MPQGGKRQGAGRRPKATKKPKGGGQQTLFGCGISKPPSSAPNSASTAQQVGAVTVGPVVAEEPAEERAAMAVELPERAAQPSGPHTPGPVATTESTEEREHDGYDVAQARRDLAEMEERQGEAPAAGQGTAPLCVLCVAAEWRHTCCGA